MLHGSSTHASCLPKSLHARHNVIQTSINDCTDLADISHAQGSSSNFLAGRGAALQRHRSQLVAGPALHQHPSSQQPQTQQQQQQHAQQQVQQHARPQKSLDLSDRPSSQPASKSPRVESDGAQSGQVLGQQPSGLQALALQTLGMSSSFGSRVASSWQPRRIEASSSAVDTAQGPLQAGQQHQQQQQPNSGDGDLWGPGGTEQLSRSLSNLAAQGSGHLAAVQQGATQTRGSGMAVAMMSLTARAASEGQAPHSIPQTSQHMAHGLQQQPGRQPSQQQDLLMMQRHSHPDIPPAQRPDLRMPLSTEMTDADPSLAGYRAEPLIPASMMQKAGADPMKILHQVFPDLISPLGEEAGELEGVQRCSLP